MEMAVSSVLSQAREITAARYERLPSLIQDGVCSVYGAQELVRRRGPYRRALERMRRIDAVQSDPEAAHGVMEARLRTILDVARGLPGYARTAPRVSSSSAFQELREWPSLSKESIRSRPKAYLSRGPGPTDISSLTSGTTGTPLQIWRTRWSFRELFLSSAVSRTWFGVGLDARRASFTGKVVVPLHSRRVWRLNAPGRQLVMSQYHIGDAHIREYARALMRWRPRYLDGYTSNLVSLAELLEMEGERVHIPLVVTTCEMLTPAGRELLERVFGGRVSDKYGSSENVAFAAECPDGTRHIFTNVGLIEAVDEDDQPVPDGEQGRLLLTTLTNDLMPLIRYEIGDVGSVDPARSCNCGRTTPVLREIGGREDDVVLTKDGRRIAIFAFNVLRGIEDVVAMQLVQRSLDSFLVRAKLGVESDAGRRRFEAAIEEAFDRLVGVDASRRLEFSYSDEIERHPGGKIRNVTREF